MKKIGLVIISVLMAASSWAQDSRQGFRFQPQLTGGYALPVASGDLYKIKTASSTDPAILNAIGNKQPYLLAGVNAGYMFNDHIGLYTGLSYCSVNWQNRVDDFFTNPVGYYTSNINQRYIQMPILLRLISSKPGNIGLVGTLGPRICMLTGVKETDTDFYTGVATTSHDKSAYRTVTTAFSFAVGLNIPCGDKITLDLMVEGQGLGPIYKSTGPKQYLAARTITAALDFPF